ncbi:MAG: tetratricopeptide repeat protein [Candidatus Kryptoniota bacterium]
MPEIRHLLIAANAMARKDSRDSRLCIRCILSALTISFLVFLLLPAVTFASQGQALMEQGNKFYQGRQYEQAIDTYQKAIGLGYEGTSLYYNLGNSYYRDGKLGFAILYYEKAKELSRGDDDVIHNLAIANTKTMDKIDMLPKFFLFQWWENLLAMFSTGSWTHVVYIFYLMLLASIGLYFFAWKPVIQRYSVYLGFITTAFLIITASIWLVNLNREWNVKSAVILDPAVTVKLAPDSTSSDAFIIHEGLKVRELDHVDRWVKIRLQDGKEGWLLKDEVGTI